MVQLVLDGVKFGKLFQNLVGGKFVLQEIDLIFNNRLTKPEILEAKVKAMLLEAVGNQIKIDPSTVEYQWIGSLQQTKPQKNFGKPFIKPKW